MLPSHAGHVVFQVEDVISQLLSISTGEAAPTRSLHVEVPSKFDANRDSGMVM